MSGADADLTIRGTAIVAFGRFAKPDEAAKAGLLAFIKAGPPFNPPASNQDWINADQQWYSVADKAAYVLGSRFGASVIDDLLPLLTPMNSPQRIPAFTALGYMGVPAIPRLTALTNHSDRSIAIAAKAAIDQINSMRPILEK